MVEDLFGVKPDPWQREALEAFPYTPPGSIYSGLRKAFRERVRARLSQF